MSKHSLMNLRDVFPASIDDFFSDWDGWFGKQHIPPRMTIPALNVSEDKDAYKVTVAAPGLEKDNFDIDVDGNTLTISAVSEKEKEEEKKKYRRREYSYSSFSRSFTMPADVKAEAIEASYDKGILTINLPKNEKTKNDTEKKVQVS